MTLDFLVALGTFAAITAYTPGPNNTILLASGINHGFQRSLPMVFAVGLGFPFMIAIVGLGLGRLFETYPIAFTSLKYGGSFYMLWLAWKIATSIPETEGSIAASLPMTFLQGALFQWVNPKGWVMAVTASSAYTTATDYYQGLIAIVVTFIVMGLSSASCWALFGVGLRHVLNDPRYFRVVNIMLALTLLLSIGMMLRH